MLTKKQHSVTSINNRIEKGNVMKKIIILFLVLSNGLAVFSQCKELIEEVKNQQMTIDSLQNKVIKALENETSKLQGQIKVLEDDKIGLNKKIKDFEKDVADLNKNKVKVERDALQEQAGRSTAQIAELSQQLSEKDKQISTEKQKYEQKLREEKEKGKNEALANLLNIYKNKKFDDLIKTSTKLSVQRDMQLVGDNAEMRPVLSDLEKYFDAEELLTRKFDAAQIKNAQIQLNQINQKSELLDKLKENVEYYKDFNDELKKTIEKLVNLDKRKVADGDAEIQKLKFQEILSELSNYMYNYYDYGNYPYLSDIVLEIIKRKQPNADADISDLLKKL